jgi:hypothetical protein
MDRKSRPIKINLKIMDALALREAIDSTFGSGGYLGSAIIKFQMVDWLLRLNILASVYPTCDSPIIEMILEQEYRFPRLVEYFGLVKQEDDLSRRLIKFNERRNNIVHRLFYAFESFDSLEKETTNFYEEGKELENILRGFLDEFLSKVTKIS